MSSYHDAVNQIIHRLLDSDEPSIRWKIRVNVLGEDPQSKPLRKLQSDIRASPRVRKLLAGRDASGRLPGERSPYDKWQGGHWVLAALADLGYPPGDAALNPLRDRVLEQWLGDEFFQEFKVRTKTDVYKNGGVPVIDGRHRRCGSQQGNALLAITKLGLDDGRAAQLVERLLHWQWPDGGWNCDKNPAADTSSFMETLLPMCGLAEYARATGDKKALAAARRAAEVFLSRKLYRRRSDNAVIRAEFAKLHYPLYWHYDILGGLKCMLAVGMIHDPRCTDALDLLEKKQLPTGGWPAEARYYKTSSRLQHNADFVDWRSPTGGRMNPWVTADALTVLRAADRLPI
jgi:hypothetical protein